MKVALIASDEHYPIATHGAYWTGHEDVRAHFYKVANLEREKSKIIPVLVLF